MYVEQIKRISETLVHIGDHAAWAGNKQAIEPFNKLLSRCTRVVTRGIGTGRGSAQDRPRGCALGQFWTPPTRRHGYGGLE